MHNTFKTIVEDKLNADNKNDTEQRKEHVEKREYGCTFRNFKINCVT